MAKEQKGLRRARNPMPGYIKEALESRRLMDSFRARPPYQQNDYLGWIGRARRQETKNKRLKQMLDELDRGDVYMKMTWKSR